MYLDDRSFHHYGYRYLTNGSRLHACGGAWPQKGHIYSNSHTTAISPPAVCVGLGWQLHFNESRLGSPLRQLWGGKALRQFTTWLSSKAKIIKTSKIRITTIKNGLTIKIKNKNNSNKKWAEQSQRRVSLFWRSLQGQHGPRHRVGDGRQPKLQLLQPT